MNNIIASKYVLCIAVQIQFSLVKNISRKYIGIKHNGVLLLSVQCNTVEYSLDQCKALQWSSVLISVTQYSCDQCNAVQNFKMSNIVVFNIRLYMTATY